MRGELSGDERQILESVVAWLRNLPESTIHDWGLNATAEIADLIDSGMWLEMPRHSDDG